MSTLKDLQPQKVFSYFEEICGIPHGSGNTKAISDYLAAFAKERGLTCYQDELHNIIILKDGTAGYENREPVILQGHMDMVCEKEKGVDIDFEKDGLSLVLEGDFLRADGTTLGGDDGIAVAYALAILDSDDIPHPPLEVIITVDEEIGMLGAYDLDVSMLKGRKMLNLDSEEEGIFLTSCAGGMALVADIPVNYTEKEGLTVTLTVTGLAGGHSGGEIDKEHGNADILMGRVLYELFEQTPFGIVSLAGGLKDNAIPRECTAVLLVPEENKDLILSIAGDVEAVLKKELEIPDPDVKVEVTVGSVTTGRMLDFSSVNKVIYYLRMVPNGVLHMSRIMPGLVETSLNLGIMELNEEALHLVTSIRSSVSSRKEDTKNRLCQLVEMLGGEYVVQGDYPAWEYKKDSCVRTAIGEIYWEQTGKEPSFLAIHAGLECGLFSEKIKDLDCVSFGPDLYDIHTPKERLSVSSTLRTWNLILEFLKRAK
jgi:dipeptidase D